MAEIARLVYHLGVHLMYGSVVWMAAWALTSVRHGSATTKYWIWVGVMLNFMLPLGGLVDRFGAAHFAWAQPLSFLGAAGTGVTRDVTTASVVGAIWLAGALWMAVRLALRLKADRHTNPADPSRWTDATTSAFVKGVPVWLARDQQGPRVHGMFRPHISLPHGIERLLTEEELDAVLLHEVAHARRRDNLIRLVYEVGLCGLWFHPLAWLTGSRLALYRELSCDESVIASARGRDLVSALAKLAVPEDGYLLQAGASSHFGDRLARLVSPQPQAMRLAANLLLTILFTGVLVTGVYATVAHTACCFLTRR